MLHRSLFVLLLFTGAALAADASGRGAPGRDAPGLADARLRALYESEWRWREEQLPDDEDSTRPVRDRLPRVDEAAQQSRRVRWEQVLGELRAIARNGADAAPIAMRSPVSGSSIQCTRPAPPSGTVTTVRPLSSSFRCGAIGSLAARNLSPIVATHPSPSGAMRTSFASLKFSRTMRAPLLWLKRHDPPASRNMAGASIASIGCCVSNSSVATPYRSNAAAGGLSAKLNAMRRVSPSRVTTGLTAGSDA